MVITTNRYQNNGDGDDADDTWANPMRKTLYMTMKSNTSCINIFCIITCDGDDNDEDDADDEDDEDDEDDDGNDDDDEEQHILHR